MTSTVETTTPDDNNERSPPPRRDEAIVEAKEERGEIASSDQRPLVYWGWINEVYWPVLLLWDEAAKNSSTSSSTSGETQSSATRPAELPNDALHTLMINDVLQPDDKIVMLFHSETLAKTQYLKRFDGEASSSPVPLRSDNVYYNEWVSAVELAKDAIAHQQFYRMNGVDEYSPDHQILRQRERKRAAASSSSSSSIGGGKSTNNEKKRMKKSSSSSMREDDGLAEISIPNKRERARDKVKTFVATLPEGMLLPSVVEDRRRRLEKQEERIRKLAQKKNISLEQARHEENRRQEEEERRKQREADVERVRKMLENESPEERFVRLYSLFTQGFEAGDMPRAQKMLGKLFDMNVTKELLMAHPDVVRTLAEMRHDRNEGIATKAKALRTKWKTVFEGGNPTAAVSTAVQIGNSPSEAGGISSSTTSKKGSP